MIRYSIDIRYKDDDARRKEYASLLNQDAPSIVIFGKMTAVDCNLVMAQVEIDEGNFYRYRTLTLPIYKIDDQWKVILGAAV
ncbi:hypothetical protein POF51_30695 [Brevibacillus sp. AG]|uniref:hypothetical protein n=1 Tax=Brevibacillus sp. AG TaxID=3020891 RepID=UPI00085298F9|nr:hypothetical protein [Brevibacillus sp. AG]MDC0765094.1 hypothetical protein [Brevibacillus sp. AG]